MSLGMSEAIILSAAVSQYIAASTEADRRALRSRFSDVLSDDIVSALEEALHVVNDSAEASSDADKTFTSLMAGLELAALPSDPTKHEKDATCAGDPTCAVHANMQFEQLFRSLMNRVVVVDDAEGPPPSSATPAMSNWPADATDVFYLVLSFLPCETVLMTCENVCMAWRVGLFEGPQAQAFWLGAVYREFPMEAGKLVMAAAALNCEENTSSAADALLDGDWRTIAMSLLCTETDDVAEEENDAESPH